MTPKNKQSHSIRTAENVQREKSSCLSFPSRNLTILSTHRNKGQYLIRLINLLCVVTSVLNGKVLFREDS